MIPANKVSIVEDVKEILREDSPEAWYCLRPPLNAPYSIDFPSVSFLGEAAPSAAGKKKAMSDSVERSIVG